MKELLGIELSDEEFDAIMCQQAEGKIISVLDGKIVLSEKTITKEEKLNALSFKYQETIENLSKAVGVATLKNNTTQIENLKKTYNEQTLKYKQEREAIVNG